ncbi:MAG: hypothetical protein ACHQXA_09910, partial [Gemmatimonadales bacterium]
STAALTDYAPGFPIVLAAPIALGAPPVPAARYVQALAAGLTTAIATALLLALIGPGAAYLGALLLIAMPAMTSIHLWVLSEPLFLALLVLTLRAMIQRPARAWEHGLWAAGANLVRFAGVFLIGVVTLWAAAQPGSTRQRVKRAAFAALPGILLQGWWHFEGIAPGGGVSAATFAGLGSALREGAATVQEWLVPGVPDGILRIAIAVIVIVLLKWTAWKALRAKDAPREFFLGLGLFAICYLGMLLFARLHVVSDVPFDDRILGPLFVVLTIGVAAIIGFRWPRWPRWLQAGTGVAIALWAAAALTVDVGQARIARAYGLGYESAEWQRSPVAQWLRTDGAARTIYSTDPAGIWFVVHRPSRLLPSTLDADTLRVFAARFAAHPSALIGFDSPFVTQVPPDSLAARLGFREAARFEHGAVWIAASAGTK